MTAPIPEHAVERASWHRLIDGLDAAGCAPRVRGDKLTARCPVSAAHAHGDAKPSLTAEWKSHGVTVVHCKVGCAFDDVVAAAGVTPADLFDAPQRPRDDLPRTKPRRRAGSDTSRASSPAETDENRPAPRRDTRSWPVVEEYPYCDEHGEVLGWKLRKEPVDGGDKTFLWKKPGRSGGRVFGAPDRTPLYNLPATVQAVAEGWTVYVCEGERCVNTLARYLADQGAAAAATCNPNGAAAGKSEWLPEYGEVLRGADVVIMADRDEAGYRHAAMVAAALDGVAASVRVVQAAVTTRKADIVEHLEAGYGLDALVPVPSSASPATEEAADNVVDFPRRGGGNDGSGGPPLVEVTTVERDSYAVVDGALVKIPQRQRKTDTSTDHNGAKRRAIEVINCVPRLLRRVRRDLCDGSRATVSHVDLAVEFDGDSVEVPAIEWDDYESLKWASDLPWANVLYKRTHSGKSDVVNAIAATSGEVPTVDAYGVLGWREVSGQWAYLHANGAIGAAGPVEDVRVEVDPELRLYTLPNPPELTDTGTVRTAVDASLRLLYDLPAHVGTPLAGAAFRAILGKSQLTVYLMGNPTTGKSSLAANVAHHYAPTVRYDDMPFQAGEDWASLPSLEMYRYVVGDAIFPAEDLAPDDGVERARKRGNKLARSQFNRASKSRAKRTADGNQPMRRPRGLMVMSGEEGLTGSAETRVVYVPMAIGEIPTDTLAGLGAEELAQQRALLTATLARWLAGRMPIQPWVDDTRANLSQALRDPHSDNPGLDNRRCDLVAELGVGYRAVLDMAVDTGAMTADEAAEIWAEVWNGLVATKAAQARMADGRSLPRRAAELLRSALVTGHLHLRSRDGGQPDDLDLLRRVGWDVPSGFGTFGTSEARPLGDTGGWTDGETLWLDKGAAWAAIERQGRAETEPLNVSRRTFAQTMVEAGLLATRPDGAGYRLEVYRRVGGTGQFVWEVPFSWLYPDDEGPTAPTASTAAPAAPTDTPPVSNPPASDDTADGGDSHDRESTDIVTPSAAAETPTRTQHTAMTSPFTAAAVVIDADHAWPVFPTDPDRLTHVAAPKVDSLADVVAWAANRRLGYAHEHTVSEDGQVWLMPDLVSQLDLPTDLPEGKGEVLKLPHIAECRSRGWQVSATGGWLSVWSQDWSLRVVVVPWLVGAVKCPLTDGIDNAAALAVRLATYAAHAGCLYTITPAVTGVHLMDVLRPGGSRLGLAEPIKPPKPALISTLEEDYLWQRAPLDSEASQAWVHAYDKNSQYLAACSAVQLGLGVAEHLAGEDVKFDPKTPGYWRVRRDAYAPDTPLLPDLVNPAGRLRSHKDMWLTTPTLAEAANLGYDVAPVEAYVFRCSMCAVEHGKTECAECGGTGGYGRALEPLYRQLKPALVDLHDSAATDPDMGAVRTTLKRTYAGGIGRLGAAAAEGTRRYRPDHRHAIIATARANLTRNLRKIADENTRYPLVVYRDCVLYASDDPDPTSAAPPALRMGTGPGAWKPAGSAPMADIVPLLRQDTRPDKAGTLEPLAAVEGK